MPQYGYTAAERLQKRMRLRIEYLKYYGKYTDEEARLVARYLEDLCVKERSAEAIRKLD